VWATRCRAAGPRGAPGRWAPWGSRPAGPVTRMKRIGNSVATNSRRRSPMARRRLTRMIGITASPSGAPGPWPARRSRARWHRTRKGPTTDDAGSRSSARRPNPTRAHPLGVPRLSTWKASGSEPGREQVAAPAGPARGRPPGTPNASCGVRANEVRKTPRPHMAAVAPTHIMSTPSGAPQSAPKAAAVTPQTTGWTGQPGEADGQELAPHDGAGPDGRRGQAGQRAGGALHAGASACRGRSR
jgi:hypothetical protein